MASSILPKDQAVPLLQQLLAEIRSVPTDRAEQFADGPRIMITGSVLDHPALIQMVEEQGGAVVADDFCNTSRYFWHLVAENGDPLSSIYSYLNNRPLCACMHPTEARLQFLLELVDAFHVEAVVNFNLKYCHPFLYEASIYKKELEAREIPITCLEVGHDLSGHGQLKTRIQAFLEMVAF
jgi:benzoyl-CoA reductase/2-hydroxyglutaryl-CoA dehydratase subunit BcrC/BadD/HgdB